MTELLNQQVCVIMSALEKGFVFRKLGLPYDYISEPDDFPRKSLPNAAEARKSIPNPSGIGTGMAQSAINHSLLFDGYLLRVECGFAHPDEDRILDRLIGGMIRLATAAPKGFLIRGLTPEGRGFYPETDLDSHVAWAYSLWRGYYTPVVALESQEKMKNVAGRWMDRIARADFKILTSDSKPITSVEDSAEDLKMLSLLAVASKVTGSWLDRYETMASENDNARLHSRVETGDILPLQQALFLLKQIDEDATRQELIRQRMAEVAFRAVAALEKFRLLQPAALEERPDFDWRGQSKGKPVPGELFSWPRVEHEEETVGATMEAALVLLLTGDKELVAPHAEVIAEALRTVPWEELILAAALVPAIPVHALGVEMELWDTELGAISAPTEPESLVAQFLTEEYDNDNPDKAGHDKPPTPKNDDSAPRPKRQRGRRRRRRR